MADSLYALSEYSAILRRRKVHFLVPAGLIFLIAAVLALTLPPVYRSTATILIEKQQIPTSLVASAVTGYAAEQIQTISKRVMKYDNLWQIAEEFDLYPGDRHPDTSYEIVQRMHDSISMEMVSEDVLDDRSGKVREVAIAFAVSFDDKSPAVAQRVAKRLTELYLEENRKVRTERAEETSTFLAAETRRLNTNVTDLEEKMAKFKSENPELMPESATLNRELLAREEQQYNEIEASIRSMEMRTSILQKRIQEEGVSDRLTSSRAELSAAREKYFDAHPDVIQLKELVETLESEQATGLTTQAYVANAMQQTLRLELEVVVANLSADRQRLSKIAANIVKFEDRIKRGPNVEQKYLALSRDYENSIEKYNEVKDKQMQARLSEQLEREQKGEHLSLLEPPRLPKEPIKPNRLGVLLLGIMLALMGGTGIAGIAEFRDHTIHGTRELAEILKTQPIGIIPVIEVGQNVS